MLGCDQALSQVSCLTGVRFLWLPGQWPRWRPGVGFPLPCSKCIHMLWAGSPWDTKASLSLGQTTGVRGMVGLATGGTGSCQEPASPPSWGGYCRIPSTWQGGVGGGCQGLDLGFQLSSWVRETRVRFSQLTHLPRDLPPPKAKQRLPSSSHLLGQTPGLPGQPHDRLVQGTGTRPLASACLPPPLPRTLKFPEAHIWKGFSS